MTRSVHMPILASSWQPPLVPSCLFFFNLKKMLLFFFTALGLRCCAWAFSSCGEQELLFIVVHGFLIAVMMGQ